MTNIAKLLKDCPKGTKLYSPLFGEVEFVGIDKQSGYPIDVTDCKGNGKSFTEFGVYFADHPDAECLLFPSKDCRTWEGWKSPIEPKFKVGNWVVFNNSHNSIYQISEIRDSYYMLTHTHGGSMPLSFSQVEFIRPWSIEDVRDGDVLSSIRGCPFIYDKYRNQRNDLLYYYAGIDGDGNLVVKCPEKMLYHFGPSTNAVPATKEQRDLLFAKMKEEGYEWDEKKKELHKIKPHYDIANFQPFDKVLTRDTEGGNWNVNLFSYYIDDEDARVVARFRCMNSLWHQCIPFNEDTKHLLGTTDMPSEEYINW